MFELCCKNKPLASESFLLVSDLVFGWFCLFLQALLKDPLYIGLRHKRVRGQAYDNLLDEFMKAVSDRYVIALNSPSSCAYLL